VALHKVPNPTHVSGWILSSYLHGVASTEKTINVSWWIFQWRPLSGGMNDPPTRVGGIQGLRWRRVGWNLVIHSLT
jgi:hypothetical protein